jgi:type IV pilus assembly protein PilE
MQRHAGHTLIEILIALAVLMVFAALVYPSYADFVVRARRTEGHAALVSAMQEQERYFSQHKRYLAFTSRTEVPDDPAGKWWSGSAARNSAYELQGRSCNGQGIGECIELVATPGTAYVDRSFYDATCGTLTLSSNGERGASGPIQQCWP